MKHSSIGHWIQDGGWNVCMDDFLPSQVYDKNPIKSTKYIDPRMGQACIVYSFGINDDPSFDIDLTTRWSDCTIYAFDPSIGRKTGDNFLGPNIKFYSIGLGGKDTSLQDESRGWEIMKLDSIMKMLNIGEEHIESSSLSSLFLSSHSVSVNVSLILPGNLGPSKSFASFSGCDCVT